MGVLHFTLSRMKFNSSLPLKSCGYRTLTEWKLCLIGWAIFLLFKSCLYYCKKLVYLPILHLTNLKHLHIDDCCNLEKRCVEGSSAKWFQIAHIPNIKINGKYIEGKDSEDWRLWWLWQLWVWRIWQLWRLWRW